MCFGCACIRDPDMQSVYFVLFDTMCGRSALHLRVDGKPTEMSALIGDGDGTGGWSGKCGTDYTVDFLFGFAGYEYQKITDAKLFKSAITASIDAGRPAIVELSSDDGTFRVITGYDADAIASSFYYTDQGKNTQEKQTKTLSYEEIKTLYIVGDKTTPRYTLKDGLERIKRVFENNISEKIWDDGIAEINKMIVNPTDDEFGKMNPDDLKAFRNRVTKTITNQFNYHTFTMAIWHLPKIHDHGNDPALSDLWDKLANSQDRLNKYAHEAGRFNGINISDIGRAGFGKMLISEFEDIKNVHLKMLEIIKQAISVLEKKAREENFKKNLSGEMLTNALAFSQWMDETSGWTHSDEGVCFTVTDPGNFYIFVYGPGSTVCNSDFNDYPISDEMRAFVHANVSHCAYIKSGGKECGCREKRWRSFTILGKKYDNLCYCCICFKNPDLKTFNKIKELVPVWKLCIDAAKQAAK